jgi:hypothetical protein
MKIKSNNETHFNTDLNKYFYYKLQDNFEYSLIHYYLSR